MLIDMHNHTRISSPCSLLSAPELIEAAQARGLDAICVTDHLYLEGANVAQEIGRQVGFPVFRGVEARTNLGDMLVFGYYRDIAEGISLEALCRNVHQAGGLIFVAHPYHEAGGSNLVGSMRARGWDLDTDWDKLAVLKELDGVEILNGQVADEVNAQARRLAARLQLPGIGGSDSHLVKMVGTAATRFEAWIQSEEQLIRALKSGRFEAVRLRSR
jgi:hypothetical protein